MKVWVARDNDGIQANDIYVWTKKPDKESGSYMPRADLGGWQVKMYAFKTTFGFTPRKGSCKQYELSLKERK